MSRNLVICCDGTNNSFDKAQTNVLRLTRSLVQDPQHQLVYYDPGVGTLPEHQFWSRVGKRLSIIAQLALGAGLDRNVEQAYTYLMQTWEPGDRVFLFGFSRGAYTVRVLASMLHNLGLLPRGAHNLVPYAMRLLGVRQNRKPVFDDFNRFRKVFARPLPSGEKRFDIHFLGIWDTVKSVGWVWEPAVFPNTAQNASIAFVRHAVAIDERRWFYRQHLMRPEGGQDFEQRWFPGVHSNVGGGYPEAHGGLWRPAFEWMVAEATAPDAGLRLDDQELDRVRHVGPPPQDAWAEPMACSLRGRWWLAEVFPKLVSVKKDGVWRRRVRIGLGRYRTISEGQVLHESALHRIREDASYRPRNLSEDFVQHVRGLANVPDALAYHPQADPPA